MYISIDITPDKTFFNLKVLIFLFFSTKTCCGYSLEAPRLILFLFFHENIHCGYSLEAPQQIFFSFLLENICCGTH